jgi:hypothetical protein
MEHGLTIGLGFREMIEKALTRLNETSFGMRNCPHRQGSDRDRQARRPGVLSQIASAIRFCGVRA